MKCLIFSLLPVVASPCVVHYNHHPLHIHTPKCTHVHTHSCLCAGPQKLLAEFCLLRHPSVSAALVGTWDVKEQCPGDLHGNSWCPLLL